MLTLNAVEKTLGKAKVIDGVSLTVAPGQTTVLLGPSGCGKSTLLRMMIGLIRPDAGEIHFGGKPLLRENVRECRQRMGYVIQDGGLFPHLTAAQNVCLMARHLNWDRQRIHNRLGQLGELTRLPARLLGAYPAELSGGQRQRVGLMRALMLDPDLLLLDEPLGALDPITRLELQSDLRSIFHTLNKAVVLVTHDIAEAAHFAHEVVILQHGRIAQRGAMRDLLEHPASPFVSEFVQAQRSPLEVLEEICR